MTAVTLRHRLAADDRVSVSLGAMTAVVTANEAKRFAWALLSDLDPDEAAAAGLDGVTELMAAFLRSRVRGAKSLALLKALREGGWVTTSELTAAVGTHARGTGVLLTRLKAKGLVTSRARDGRSHHWRLTTLGCEVVK